MEKYNLFYLTYFLTILVVRIYLYFFREVHIILWGVLVHHFWIGLILIIVSLFLYKKYEKERLVIFGIGAALFFDQLVFILNGGGLTPAYLDIISLAGSIVFVILFFIFRKKVIGFLDIKIFIHKVYIQKNT